VDLIVLPSTWQDPCPLVVLEAMASGTCLISSAVGGIPEILETGKNGILVEPGDVCALADAVCSTLNAPEIMTKMENTARQKIIAGYTWERLVGELEPILTHSKST
jgi:spore coat protein SA